MNGQEFVWTDWRPQGGRCRGGRVCVCEWMRRTSKRRQERKKNANNDMGYIGRREEVPVGGPGKVSMYIWGYIDASANC
jgi:hypothetical protein